MEEGDDVALLGVLGNGYDIEKLSTVGNDKPSKVLLLGGGIGIPPMLELAKELHGAGVMAISVMGYRDDRTFLLDEFKEYSDTYFAPNQCVEIDSIRYAISKANPEKQNLYLTFLMYRF